MPITEIQRERRQRHIGSSDAAAILGIDPWKGAYEVWLEKTGKLEDAPLASEAADIGNMIEGALLDWASSEIGVPIVKNQRRVHPDLPFAANHDAIARTRPEGFEAKTTGILTPHLARDEWGEPGTDEVPERVIVQCHHQMIVSDLNVVWVPALIGGRGRIIYRVERNQDLCNAMTERLVTFWRECVEAGIPPDGDAPSLECLKRVRREPKTETAIPQDLLSRWLETKAIASAANDQEEQARAALLTALGDAEKGNTPIGSVTYLEQSRRDIDRLKLREDFPEAATACERVTTYRVLRFKKPPASKGEKV